ncbi:MAG: DUF4139 domain-containing protein [Smithellaceae bacterium]|nr:DUF4139 domain-containing protein [Smithellaceae bacterium]
MPKNIFFRVSVTVILMFLLSGPVSHAAPVYVTFFPDSALVHETATVKFKADTHGPRRATLILPAQADVESLRISLAPSSKATILDRSQQQVARPDNERIGKLTAQINALNEGRKGIIAEIQGLDSQIQYWQTQTKDKAKTIGEAANMAVAIGKFVKKAFYDKALSEAALEKMDRRIDEAKKELERIVGNQEKVWEVTLVVAGADVGDLALDYTYLLGGCGWSPAYRFEALPDQKKILFNWEAELWQSSGQDWSGVDISVATMASSPRAIPPDIPDWIIQPRPSYRLKAQKFDVGRDGAAMMARVPEVAQTPEEELPFAPTQTRLATYSLWHLGKRNVPAGDRLKVSIAEESWDGVFSHVVRPAVSTDVFLMAEIKFPEGKDIPSGSANFIVAGASLGKRDFVFSGDDLKLFFGTDPLISAKTELLSRGSGEKTFLADKQTFQWSWQIAVKNNKDKAVTLRVEEPRPQTRDERIKLFIKQAPTPTEQTPALDVWQFELSPAGTASISENVRLEAPKDMNLDLGWR